MTLSVYMKLHLNTCEMLFQVFDKYRYTTVVLMHATGKILDYCFINDNFLDYKFLKWSLLHANSLQVSKWSLLNANSYYFNKTRFTIFRYDRFVINMIIGLHHAVNCHKNDRIAI